MTEPRDYEFEATNICAEIIFECAADDAVVMAAIEAGLNAAQAVLPIQDTCELSILICDDETITELNAEWRGKNYATNVLSFPAQPHSGESLKSLGDMAISLTTTQREAADMGIPPAHHLTHLAIHSLLHLLGYDHETEAEAEIMEALEMRAMAHIGLPNPYEGDRCRPVMDI